MNYTLRPLRADELDAWFTFIRTEIFPDDPIENLESMRRNLSEDDIAGIFVAIDPQGDIVASVQSACRDHVGGLPCRMGIISGVGTRRDCRGQGLCRKLFALSDAYLLARNAPIAHLYSEPDTLALYQRLGFFALPRRLGEDFFRMYRIIRPFPLNDTLIASAAQLIPMLA